MFQKEICNTERGGGGKVEIFKYSFKEMPR